MTDESRPVPYPWPKWLLDKTVALGLIVVLSPVFLIVLVVVGLDMLAVPEDRGSWLYRERRVSRGREFDLLKFRVLRREMLDELRARGDYARRAEADPRNLTWAGHRLLKPWYLDELPQLVNILRGEMSLVGPRPWPVSMVAEQTAQGYVYRNEIRAGWTGPAQVTKGAPDPISYATLDLAYVEACRTWSDRRLLRFDLVILFRTLRVLVRGQGLSD